MKKFIEFLKENDCVLEIGGLRIKLSDDLDIIIDNKLYQWINEKSLENETYETNKCDSFKEELCKDEIKEIQKEKIDLLSEIENLKDLITEKDEIIKKYDNKEFQNEKERIEFDFLKKFISNRDIVIHDNVHNNNY